MARGPNKRGGPSRAPAQGRRLHIHAAAGASVVVRRATVQGTRRRASVGKALWKRKGLARGRGYVPNGLEQQQLERPVGMSGVAAARLGRLRARVVQGRTRVKQGSGRAGQA